jgi:hypothetical protein
VAIIALLPTILIVATVNGNSTLTSPYQQPIAEASIYKSNSHNFNCGINPHAPPCCDPPTTDKECIKNSLGQNQTNRTKSNLP